MLGKGWALLNRAVVLHMTAMSSESLEAAEQTKKCQAERNEILWVEEFLLGEKRKPSLLSLVVGQLSL